MIGTDGCHSRLRLAVTLANSVVGNVGIAARNGRVNGQHRQAVAGASPRAASTAAAPAPSGPAGEITIQDRQGRMRKAYRDADGRVKLDTLSGPKTFESEDAARAYLA